jgi:parvulin-like peptidyl-prolyl isomerase
MSIYKMRTEMGHYFKWLLLLVLVPIFVIGGINYFGGGRGMGLNDRGRGGGDVIAVVNNSPITRQEFEQTWDQMIEQARRNGMRSALQYADMRVGIFQQLVSDRLVLAAAEQLGVEVNDRAVNDQIDKMVTMYLKENRRTVLGKLSAKKEAVDPRDDDEYKAELERAGMSLNKQIEMAESRMPREQVRAQLAQQAIAQRIEARVKPVTERDLMASYNVYKIRQLVLQPTGLPKAQFDKKVKSVQEAAKSGADFAKLVADNSSDPSAKKTGGEVVYSFETRMMFPPKVRDAIAKLSPGQISSPIKTDYATYIVKLESMEPRLPAKLDDKAKQARRQEITQDRQAAAKAELEAQIRPNDKVDVKDPEFKAYWAMMQMNSAASPQDYAQRTKAAVKALKEASRSRGNSYVQIQLARMLDRQGQTAEAVRILYPMLEGKEASIEGPDLRILLGDMLMKTGIKGDKERAIQQYQEAGEVAPHDPQIHSQLQAKFKEVKRPDLAAKEQAWMNDFIKQMAEVQAMRKKQSGAPVAPPKE